MYSKCKEHCFTCENKDICILCDVEYNLMSEYTFDNNDNNCVPLCDLSNSRWYIDLNGEFTCLFNQDYCPLNLRYIMKIKKNA